MTSTKTNQRTWKRTAEELLSTTDQVHVLLSNQQTFLNKLRSESPPPTHFQPPPRSLSTPPTLDRLLPSNSFLLDDPNIGTFLSLEHFSLRRSQDNKILVRHHRLPPVTPTTSSHNTAKQKSSSPPPSIAMSSFAKGRSRAQSKSNPEILTRNNILTKLPSSSSTTTMEDVQRRRLSLVLRKELRPINVRFEKRQIQQSQRWHVLLALHRSLIAVTGSIRRSQAATTIKRSWRKKQARQRWRRLTRPEVVRGLIKLRECVRKWSNARSIRIVSTFVVEANISSFSKLILKLQFRVIRIQRCWRNFCACTATRIRSLELKWALIERHHRLELVDIVRLAKISESKRGGGSGWTCRRATFDTMARNTKDSRRHQEEGKNWTRSLRKSSTTTTSPSSSTIGYKNREEGSILAVARLDKLLTSHGEQEMSMSPQQRKQAEDRTRTTRRAKARTEACDVAEEFNSTVPRHWKQFNAPPPAIVINVELRRHHCAKMLLSSRKRFVAEEEARKRSKRVGVFGDVSVDAMKEFLLGDRELALRETTEEEKEEAKRMEKARPCLILFTDVRNHRQMMFQAMKIICQDNPNVMESTSSYTKRRKKKSPKEIQQMFRREANRPVEQFL